MHCKQSTAVRQLIKCLYFLLLHFTCSAVCSDHVRGHLPLLQLVFSHPKVLPSSQDLLALGHPAHLHNCGLHWSGHHCCEQDTCSKAALHHLAWNRRNCGLHLSCISALWRSAPPLPKCNEEIHSTASGHHEENSCILWYCVIWFGNVCGASCHALHLVHE